MSQRDLNWINAYKAGATLTGITEDRRLNPQRVSRQRVLQILQKSGVWAPREKKARIKICKVCYREYLYGEFSNHLAEYNHKTQIGNPKFDHTLAVFLGTKGFGSPIIAKYFGVAQSAVAVKLRAAKINNNDSGLYLQIRSLPVRERAIFSQRMLDAAVNEFQRSRDASNYS